MTGMPHDERPMQSADALVARGRRLTAEEAASVPWYTRGAGGRIYPWDQWLDGAVWELVRGRDFETEVKSMLALARKTALTRGGRLRTRTLRDDTIVIQFLDEAPRKVRWSAEEILDAIRAWNSKHGAPPSAADWARSDPDGKWPSSLPVTTRFGSWNNAIEAAGLTPRRAGTRK